MTKLVWSAVRTATGVAARSLVLPLLWAGTVAYFLVLFDLLIEVSSEPELYAFGAGGFISVALLARGMSFPLLATLTHELVHAVAGWIIGSRIMELWVSRDPRGGTCHSDEKQRSNGFVALAPYCVPALALACTGLAAILRPPLHFGAVAAAGFLDTNFLVDTAQALRVQQPDLLRFGSSLLATSLIVESNVMSAAITQASISSAGVLAPVVRSARCWQTSRRPLSRPLPAEFRARTRQVLADIEKCGILNRAPGSAAAGIARRFAI